MVSPPLCHDLNHTTLESAIKDDPYGGAGGGGEIYVCDRITILIHLLKKTPLLTCASMFVETPKDTPDFGKNHRPPNKYCQRLPH